MFSGGGTRAAAFSYGVLEFLRRTEVTEAQGQKARLLDHIDIITGVSGGSFTALAYGLYGDKLFDDYEQRYLKRDVQGEIIARTFSPRNWGNLWSLGWGRSELAAQLYDEILFHGATFGDLNRGRGPLITFTNRMKAAGLMKEQDFLRLRDAADAEVAAAVQFAENSPSGRATSTRSPKSSTNANTSWHGRWARPP